MSYTLEQEEEVLTFFYVTSFGVFEECYYIPAQLVFRKANYLFQSLFIYIFLVLLVILVPLL